MSAELSVGFSVDAACWDGVGPQYLLALAVKYLPSRLGESAVSRTHGVRSGGLYLLLMRNRVLRVSSLTLEHHTRAVALLFFVSQVLLREMEPQKRTRLQTSIKVRVSHTTAPRFACLSPPLELTSPGPTVVFVGGCARAVVCCHTHGVALTSCCCGTVQAWML